jgi:lipopolysaccharide/colanic/teichoic acid biosynthesis glycosyltransferase
VIALSDASSPLLPQAGSHGLTVAAGIFFVNTATGFYGTRADRSFFESFLRACISLAFALPLTYLILSLAAPGAANASLVQFAAMAGVAAVILHRGYEVASSAAKASGRSRILIFGSGEAARVVGHTLRTADRNAHIVGFFAGPNERDPAVPAAELLSNQHTLLQTVRDQRVGDGFNQGLLRSAHKRVFDIIGAILLLAVSAPVMVAATLAIRLDSRGPALYRQERVGKNGKSFTIIKFRSMRTDSEVDGKPRWATAGDDRVTRIGRLLRRTRIDELPQLFSVLKGDMSLVGPRPERPFFVEQLTQAIPFYSVRHSVKPGVTGWAQVRYQYGSTVEDSQEKLQYDLYYVKNHGLLLDLKIMFETVSVVLTGKGAR